MTPYEQFRPHFAAMLNERKWPLWWLDKEIDEGRAVAMGDEAACIVVALRQYPGGMVEVHGLCAAGNMHRIVRLIGEAEAWGREQGAELATISSRRGWARALKDAGYSETQVMIEKELRDGT